MEREWGRRSQSKLEEKGKSKGTRRRKKDTKQRKNEKKQEEQGKNEEERKRKKNEKERKRNSRRVIASIHLEPIEIYDVTMRIQSSSRAIYC